MLFEARPVPGRIVFVDTEFTTLDKGRRHPWEIAVIVRDPGKEDVEIEWQIRPPLAEASPESLRIGRFYERCRLWDMAPGHGLVVVAPGIEELRRDGPIDEVRRVTVDFVASGLARMLDGAYLVGKVVSADELTLERFLHRLGHCLTSHYRLRCVETMAHGFLLGKIAELNQAGRGSLAGELAAQIPPPPWDPKVLARLCGVEPSPADQAHRALVDARHARDLWDAIHGLPMVGRSTETSD